MTSSSSHQDDLDLLLSLQDRVLETPPGSPGYLSDDGLQRRNSQPDMSVFRDVVQDCLHNEVELKIEKAQKLKLPKKPDDADVEKYSGLRIKNQIVSSVELSNHLSDIRFIRLPAIKNMLMGETLSGSWVTVGVLTEKGCQKTSTNGGSYCIWKLGCLDEKTVSVFLFSEAYQNNYKEPVGTVFALFNCSVRKDAAGTGFSLSVFSTGQMLKVGTSVDYGVCKGKRKDGMTCTLAVNKRQGIYCSFHNSKSTEKYSNKRAELKGGNLRTGFRQYLKSEGVYMVDPQAERTNVKKSAQPVKLLSVDALKKALSNAGKVTSNTHSQGIRFLTEVTGNISPKKVNKTVGRSKKQMSNSEKRPSSTMKVDAPSVRGSAQMGANKRVKIEPGQAPAMKTKQVTEKMIELEYISSDEDI